MTADASLALGVVKDSRKRVQLCDRPIAEIDVGHRVVTDDVIDVVPEAGGTCSRVLSERSRIVVGRRCKVSRIDISIAATNELELDIPVRDLPSLLPG